MDFKLQLILKYILKIKGKFRFKKSNCLIEVETPGV